MASLGARKSSSPALHGTTTSPQLFPPWLPFSSSSSSDSTSAGLVSEQLLLAPAAPCQHSHSHYLDDLFPTVPCLFLCTAVIGWKPLKKACGKIPPPKVTSQPGLLLDVSRALPGLMLVAWGQDNVTGSCYSQTGCTATPPPPHTLLVSAATRHWDPAALPLHHGDLPFSCPHSSSPHHQLLAQASLPAPEGQHPPPKPSRLEGSCGAVLCLGDETRRADPCPGPAAQTHLGGSPRQLQLLALLPSARLSPVRCFRHCLSAAEPPPHPPTGCGAACAPHAGPRRTEGHLPCTPPPATVPLHFAAKIFPIQ